MPKMTLKQFCEQVEAKKANGFDNHERTLVILGGHHESHFFAPMRYRLAHGKFIMEAKNQWDHPFTFTFHRHADKKTLELNLGHTKEPVVTFTGDHEDFLLENLKVVHHNSLSNLGVVKDIEYSSMGDLHAVLEEIATPMRISNTGFRRSFYAMHNTEALIKGIFPTLYKLL